MARPETVEDLQEHERKAHEFVRVDPQFITTDVAVGAALLTLIDVARKSSAFVVDEDGQFLISVPLTTAELDSRLRTAQRMWEYHRDEYAKAGIPLYLVIDHRNDDLRLALFANPVDGSYPLPVGDDTDNVSFTLLDAQITVRARDLAG